MKKIVIFLLIAGVLCFEINAQVIYVASDATGNNDGTSWQDAFTDLQDALTGTTGEVWVKVGTYFPTSGTDQNISFILNRDLYGGFNGTETARSQRDFRANETILSGNIGDPNDDQDNSFSIIDARNFSLIGLPGLIDGFTITKSQSGNTYDGQIGSHSIKNCIFEETVGNTAIFLNSISGAEIANCIFRNIDVSAGISTSAATITITSFTSNTVDIVNNLIFNAGNGIIILFANGTILNNSIVNNAGFSITDFQNSNLTVANNIITGNALTTSVLSGTLTNNIIEGTTDPNNFDLDPGFKDALNNDFSLTVCSDARNLGDNAFVPVRGSTSQFASGC